MGYYLCPASYNFGCCQTGYGCALNACWATSPLTWVLTYTTTRGGSEATVTTTTVSTPTQPAGLPTSDTTAAFPKLIPTTEPKAEASAAPSSGGLTRPQLGGIIGGAIALLVIVILVAFIIIKRLNRTARIVQSAKASTSDDLTRTEKKNSTQVSVAQIRVRPTTSEVDAMDYDPLMMTGTANTPASVSYGRSRSGSELSGQTTPFPPVPSGGRQSVDSHQSYFDIPRPSNFPGRHANSVGVRSSVDSQSQYQDHARHWSNASDLSTGSGGEARSSGVGSPLMPAELSNEGGFVPELAGSDTETEGRRRSSTSVASPRGTSPYMGPHLSRPPMTHQRRRSDGHSRGRSESAAPPQSLDVVNEGSEFTHGYYGPNNVAAGQTNAGLDISYDISSPVGPRQRSDG